MLPTLLLLLSLLALRVLPWTAGQEVASQLSGWAPLMAFACCGGAFLPKRLALWLPAAGLIISGVIVNALADWPLFHPAAIVVAAASVAAAAAGSVVRSAKVSLPVLVTVSLSSTVLFYLVSNTVSFFVDPFYPRSFAGWVQCLTTGHPEFNPPTWVFGLRQLVADSAFTVLFWALCRSRTAVAFAPLRGIAPATHA